MGGDGYLNIIIEAIEVFLNHIVYLRGVYPEQIFKKRRIYNTPVYVSIYPPLNTYLASVLRTAGELLERKSLQCFEIIIFRSDLDKQQQQQLESYRLETELCQTETVKDPHLIDYEQQLRSSLYRLGERLKQLPKLDHNCQFKVQLHTTQTGFVQLSHEAQYQEFPWLQAENQKSELNEGRRVALLPLTTVEQLGLKMHALIFSG